jgi:hypothetical protein
MATRAADDFGTIAARLKEIASEKGLDAPPAPKQPETPETQGGFMPCASQTLPAFGGS